MAPADLEKAPLIIDDDGAIQQKSDGEDEFICSAVPEFVPSWEGIRGIAIVMTCVCHIQAFSYAFDHNTGRSGVGIFFVLSGYLITGNLLKLQVSQSKTIVSHCIHLTMSSLLYQTKQSGSRMTFTLRHLPRFYSNRLIRLYPALLSCVLMVYALSYTVQRQIDPRASLGFWPTLTYTTSNLVHDFQTFWWNTWSLCVEEQFYLLWSFLLPILFLFKPIPRRMIMAALLATSFAINYIRIYDQKMLPDYLNTYFNLPTSVWRLLAGALLRITPMPNWALSRLWAWLGLLLISASLFTSLLLGDQTGLNNQLLSHEPIAVVAAVMMVNGSLQGNALLELPWLRFLGRISYSLYLYQHPLWAIGGYPKGYMGLGLTALAFIFAMVSTLYIEEPVRELHRKWRTKSKPAVKEAKVVSR